MDIKGTGFAYNVTTDGHSNSDWGAEIGQGNKKLMNVPGVSEILNGMLYYKVDESQVSAILGKGNRTAEPLPQYMPDISIVLASVIQKVSVNGALLPNTSFIMFITKDERTTNSKGASNTHYQRRYLKFSDNATYNGVAINQQCMNAITRQLGCSQTGSWIVTEMHFEEEVLALKAIVVDANNPHDFIDKDDRDRFLQRLKYIASQSTFKPSSYSGSLSSIILYGPPGTGKTHTMQQDYVSKFTEDNRFVTTFHQSFSYEEFVEGLKPVLDDSGEGAGDIKYKINPGVFRKACERAAQLAGYATLFDCVNDTKDNRKASFDKAITDKKLVLLCIDEINRGNIASILGDLISLIEDSKRLGAEKEMMVTLPYSQDKFGVPANLLIVGTMNTADRSIQLLDSALRRRFQFQEFLPDYSVFVGTDPNIQPVMDDAKKILQRINARVRCLLNKDNQIGHSFLMFAKSRKDIFDAITARVIPLLEEYFYNDTTKVRFVLNENEKTKYPFYQEDKVAKQAFDSFISEGDLETEDKDFFELNYKVKSEADCVNYLKHLLGESES